MDTMWVEKILEQIGSCSQNLPRHHCVYLFQDSYIRHCNNHTNNLHSVVSSLNLHLYSFIVRVSYSMIYSISYTAFGTCWIQMNRIIITFIIVVMTTSIQIGIMLPISNFLELLCTVEIHAIPTLMKCIHHCCHWIVLCL